MSRSRRVSCLITSDIIQTITSDRGPLVVKAPKAPSSYRGVRWNHGRWCAQIKMNGHKQNLGTYDTEEEAARAYDEKAKQINDGRPLNFLPDGSLNPDRKLKYVESRRNQTIDPLVMLHSLTYHLRQNPYNHLPQAAAAAGEGAQTPLQLPRGEVEQGPMDGPGPGKRPTSASRLL